MVASSVSPDPSVPDWDAAWGVATVLWPALPRRWRWVPVAVATLNAIARVYLGAHNPLDVLGGGAIGIAVGALLVAAVTPDRLRG